MTVKMLHPRRDDGHYMYFIEPSHYDLERGYRVSVVIEGRLGYFPTGGDNTKPDYWGHDLEKAKILAVKRNKDMLGLTDADMARILLSSCPGRHVKEGPN